MTDERKTIKKTEKDFSIKSLVLKRFSSDEITVKEKALIPIKTLERISNRRPVKKPIDSEMIKVEVRLI